MAQSNAIKAERSSAGKGWRAIEFFAGIGGFATAWPHCEVCLAIDVNRHAERIYRLNHRHPFRVAEIESFPAELLNGYRADLWWLSPPCQPYSRRGKQRDLADPRSRALLHLIGLIEKCRPPIVALENVLGFEVSQAFDLVMATLEREGYTTQSLQLCPTELGWPNRRPRFYMLASQCGLTPWRTLPSTLPVSLRDLGIPSVGADKNNRLWLDDSQAQALFSAIDRVDPANANAVTACFASSYGKSLLRSGSYLQSGKRYRRFSPREVATLMGYPLEFNLADDMSERTLWKLLGNSLSIAAVGYVLSHLPFTIQAK